MMCKLLEDRVISDQMGDFDYPVTPESALEFLLASQETPSAYVYGILLGESLIGMISLQVEHSHSRAELGFWIGTAFWNKGYCTEAANAMIAFGFTTLALHRIFSMHYTRNSASGAVLRKLTMRHEGTQRGHYFKNGVFEDVELYGLLREEWEG